MIKIKIQEIMKIVCPKCGHNTISEVRRPGIRWRMLCDFCNGWWNAPKNIKREMKYKN